MCSNESTPSIMVFRPTWSDFKNFSSFIGLMESQGAHKAGIVKVIPPPEWKPRKKSYDEDDIMSLKITTPVCQVVEGKQGCYQQINVVNKPMTVAEYKRIAESDAYKTPMHFDYNDLERDYWDIITSKCSNYGVDVSGSIIDKDIEVWNINKLGTILDSVNEDYGDIIEGVNTSYLYFGMWKTSFAWHTEDMDLYSIHYIHEGYPKTWYAIPPEHGHRLEMLATRLFPTCALKCPVFLRHKMTIIAPYVLKEYSIPFNKITQERGEFIITFPFGYHAGFNHGYNITESTNFASASWMEHGKKASKCHCHQASVKISTYVKPEKYELWLQGNDIGTHLNFDFKCYSYPDIPKCYNAAGRKYHSITLNLLDSELFNNTTNENKAIDVSSSTSIQLFDEQAEGDEELSDKQGELMEDTEIYPNDNEEHLIDGIQYNITDMVINRCSVEIERLYNIYMSIDDPYCSLCMMFNRRKVTFNLYWQTKAIYLMHSNLPKLQTSTKALFKHVLSGSDEVFKEDLVRCENCYLTVHKVCYGIIVDTSNNWLCDRCYKNPLVAFCPYCPLQVGALRDFEANVWSHVECYLFVHGSIPLNTNTFSTQFLTNQKCVICKLTWGNCFRCSEGSCDAWFHISCGKFAGFDYLYDRNNKHIIIIKCNNHLYVPNEQRIIHINQKVWVRHLQHKRISECRIVKIDKTPLAVVKFSDGTISDSIILKEIKNYANDLPAINNEIHLESGDKGLFLGLNYQPIYSVEFNDGTYGCLGAHDIYSDDPQIMSHLKLQAKHGLAKYQKEKKYVYDVIF